MLQALREERGMSQAELSRRSGVAQAIISYIEAGKTPNPRIDTVIALAQVLGVTVDELVKERKKQCPTSSTRPGSTRQPK